MSLAHRARALVERHFGIHVGRVHFYSPIPELRELDPSISTHVKSCPGIDFREVYQRDLLETLTKTFAVEFTPEENIGLSKVDAFLLYALIRSRRPGKIVEVGAGESTKIILTALEKNVAEGFPCRLTSIDPFPPGYLRAIDASHFDLRAQRVQEIPEGFFHDTDLLFIDSSHVSKIGSDVNYEILSIVPQLKVGALVHWHDIMLPQDYPMDWIARGMYWNESYLVHAFMLFNDAFQTVWAARYMQVHHGDALRRVFPYFETDHRLSSFWIERAR
jgi:predicted O-methyltransferase YrrM